MGFSAVQVHHQLVFLFRYKHDMGNDDQLRERDDDDTTMPYHKGGFRYCHFYFLFYLLTLRYESTVTIPCCRKWSDDEFREWGNDEITRQWTFLV
jgi:hypothetical protein